ncbi:hypothetical protein Afil01_56600 [Actinorhabdospora filicis]|uniref:Uncharacterized protein n=1 Tax=Actinorhabdospora filicis TaxID=1785913 RepID=A0A9W6SR69_9ACTN|nr:hypothetical protein Afil01_56600 [Actinorhabdospora filicis]
MPGIVPWPSDRTFPDATRAQLIFMSLTCGFTTSRVVDAVRRGTDREVDGMGGVSDFQIVRGTVREEARTGSLERVEKIGPASGRGGAFVGVSWAEGYVPGDERCSGVE